MRDPDALTQGTSLERLEQLHDALDELARPLIDTETLRVIVAELIDIVHSMELATSNRWRGRHE